MATTGAGAAERQSEKTGISQIVVVDIDEAQPSQRVKLLRKGRGKLMARVERIVADLAEAGTIKSGAQPVVIVVREAPSPFWFLGEMTTTDRYQYPRSGCSRAIIRTVCTCARPTTSLSASGQRDQVF